MLFMKPQKYVDSMDRMIIPVSSTPLLIL